LRLCGCCSHSINNIEAGDTTNNKTREAQEPLLILILQVLQHFFQAEHSPDVIAAAMSRSAQVRGTASGSATAVITVYLIFTR
jgi:hypothetical protein